MLCFLFLQYIKTHHVKCRCSHHRRLPWWWPVRSKAKTGSRTYWLPSDDQSCTRRGWQGKLFTNDQLTNLWLSYLLKLWSWTCISATPASVIAQNWNTINYLLTLAGSNNLNVWTNRMDVWNIHLWSTLNGYCGCDKLRPIWYGSFL